MDHDAPVAQLVTEPLDHDGPVVGDVAARLALFGEVRQHVLGGPGVQAGRHQPQPGVLLSEAAELAEERADRAPQFERPAELVALPERQPARHSGGGVTRTRSRVMSSIRHEVVPRVKTSPTRDS